MLTRVVTNRMQVKDVQKSALFLRPFKHHIPFLIAGDKSPGATSQMLINYLSGEWGEMYACCTLATT